MVAELGRLEPVDLSFAGERPLFAALGDFAFERGGPLTKLFLEELPESFDGPLIVDSSLLWLNRGQGPRTRWFHHEVFPGETRNGYGRANGELGAEHVACAFGAGAGRDFLVGRLPDPESLYCVDPEQFVVRDERLRRLRDERQLGQAHVAARTLHRYSGASFLRALPADAAGFHFFIRASRGSERAVVNGFRNVAGSTFTGPWQQEFQHDARREM